MYVSLRLFGNRANTQGTVNPFFWSWMVQSWVHSPGAALKFPSSHHLKDPPRPPSNVAVCTLSIVGVGVSLIVKIWRLSEGVQELQRSDRKVSTSATGGVGCKAAGVGSPASSSGSSRCGRRWRRGGMCWRRRRLCRRSRVKSRHGSSRGWLKRRRSVKQSMRISQILEGTLKTVRHNSSNDNVI